MLERLLPRMRCFAPDILFFSAGFDAHYDDMYHFLTEDDFHWLTLALCAAAPTARVVSVLEGGYSLGPTVLSKSAASPSTAALRRFALESGDGGLVKGVLAHVAALAGRDDWDDDAEKANTKH